MKLILTGGSTTYKPVSVYMKPRIYFDGQFVEDLFDLVKAYKI